MKEEDGLFYFEYPDFNDPDGDKVTMSLYVLSDEIGMYKMFETSFTDVSLDGVILDLSETGLRNGTYNAILKLDDGKTSS